MANTTPANPNASIEGQALQTLLNVLTASQSPDMQQAQAFLLRRLALEGDVVPSRLPAPLNVSEMGGYINLLGTLGMTDARSQMLASALGIAGPSPALGTLGEQPPIAWLTFPNDRPIGPQQGSISLSIQVRADFAPALQAAIQALHDQGCALPLLSTPPGAAAGHRRGADRPAAPDRPYDMACPRPGAGQPRHRRVGCGATGRRTLAGGESSRERRTDTGRAASVECADLQRLSLHGLAAAGCRKGLCPLEPGAGQRRLRPNHSRRRAGQRPSTMPGRGFDNLTGLVPGM